MSASELPGQTRRALEKFADVAGCAQPDHADMLAESSTDLLNQAADAIQARRLEAAALLLRQAADAEPENPEIIEALGRLLFESGQVAEAKGAFALWRDLQPASAAARANLAAAHLRLDDIESFEAELGAALELDPENREALQILGDLNCREQRFEDAIHAYQGILRNAPDDAATLNSAGFCHFQLGDLLKARTLFARALKADPACAAALENLRVADQRLKTAPPGAGWAAPSRPPGRPVVVGAPRSGFSLLIHVANAVLNLQPKTMARDEAWRRLLDLLGHYATRRYVDVFEKFGVANDLVFNGEFHRLAGGPKWLDKDQPERACFRKYFGLRGQGDFLLVTSHPREVLEYYGVIHSHTAPGLWLTENTYENAPKLSSVRNPIGIINSASFSLNAMASEYIQRFLPGESEDIIRQRHGLYKLTDLDFMRGLVKFLKGYLDEFLAVRDQYFVMKWEDLISHPVPTIQRVAKHLGRAVSREEAMSIWKPMDHVNLLQHHQHNYRRGKGIVGDWKNSLVNEHMDIFREFGFDEYLAELGYSPVPDLNPEDYSPYQRLVAAYLARGEVNRNFGDSDLFGFAFNKSNIDASKFNFKAFPRKKWTQVERSTVADDALVEAVSEAAEDVCEEINAILAGFIQWNWMQPPHDPVSWRDIPRLCWNLLEESKHPDRRRLCQEAFGSAAFTRH